MLEQKYLRLRGRGLRFDNTRFKHIEVLQTGEERGVVFEKYPYTYTIHGALFTYCISVYILETSNDNNQFIIMYT